MSASPLWRSWTPGVGDRDMRIIACFLLIAWAWAQDAQPPQPPVPAAAATTAAIVPAESKPLFSDQEWNATQAPAAKSTEVTSASSTAMTMLIGLVLVILVALGLGWMLRRMQARKFVGGRSRNLELLETVAIAPRRSLVLVRCGAHWLVIGVGEKELVNVATLPAPVAAADVAATPVPAPTLPNQPSVFGNELSRLLGARTQPGERP